ncbi:MAG: ABC transporter permease [Caldilineaceae bacterium]|nr:ABC transporter permease [Caldilineaceae bacterium]MCB9148451.1 ABC transporter permease [Caldilineaceae bacterium]
MNLSSAFRLSPAQAMPAAYTHLRNLVAYRELIYYLVVRDLRARYKNSVLGFLWSLLNPLALMLVFTTVFTIMRPGHNIQNYPIYVLCGLLPWNYFAAGLLGSTNSIVAGAGLIKKVYFPREALPIAAVLSQLVNFLLAFVVLFVALVVFQSPWSAWLWLLPLVILMQTCFILGLSFILATINVFYRDVMMIIDVVILAWFFLTPVFYPISAVPATVNLLGFTLPLHRLMYVLNPMASLINAYRDILYWGYRTDLDFLVRTLITSLVILIFGYWFFQRYSGRFGEEL